MITRDELDLIEELLLGCAPGSDRIERISIAISALRAQSPETVNTVASWTLGALAAMLSMATDENTDLYRAKVRALMRHARNG